MVYKSSNDGEYTQTSCYEPLIDKISITPKSENKEVHFFMIGGRYSKNNNDGNALKMQIIKLKEKNLLEECKTLVKKIFPNCDDFQLYNDEVMLVKNNSLNYKMHLGGSGVRKLIRICAALTLYKQDILILDEPEESLHPTILKNLSKELSQETKTRQIIIITHSPYLIGV